MNVAVEVSGGTEDIGAFRTGPPKARLVASLQGFLALPAHERCLGPFLLVEQLGRGGFAPVWLAREVYGGTELRTAAVKLFPLGTSDEEPGSTAAVLAARAQVLDEARALCRVEHPNVVRFYSLPMDEARGIAGLAMEHVAGTSLDRRLAARGRLTVPETLAIGIAIASALAAAHRKGIVHRDVKPANVVEAAGDYKLIDFGIAAADPPGLRRAAHNGEHMELDDLPVAALGTRASAVIGSPASWAANTTNARTAYGALACGTLGYVDPVCLASGAPATEASDLYALGAMLFECLAGHVPAAKRAHEPAGLVGKVLDGRAPPPPLAEVEPDVPPALARLVDALVAPARRDRPTSAEWVTIVLEQIRAEIAGVSRPVPPESIGPFRGLGRFRDKDRGVYFGRSSEIAASLELLRRRGLLALVGPSGSGKSSLARAGVLPAVADGELGGWPQQWDVYATEPGNDPRAAVATALAPIVQDAGALEPGALIAELAERARAAQRGVVLLIDQLEELATLAAGPSREWVVLLLNGLASQVLPGVRAVVTARRDLLDPLLALDGLGKALIRGSVLIEPISASTWAAVLDHALAAYGYSLEDEALREEIAAGIAETGSAMPLLQFALTELWEKRDAASKKITRAGLKAIGGLAGALERHAEATLAELGEEIADAEGIAKVVLLSLTTPQGTRAVRSVDELLGSAGPRVQVVLEAFERARLVVSSAEGLTLAHEALLSQWRRLREWVEEAREARFLGEELERDAARWRADPRLAPLWRKHRLAFGEGLVKEGHARLSEDAGAFLQASRRAERWSRLTAGAAVAAALLGIAGAGAGYVRALETNQQTMRWALDEARQRRELAEQRTREVQEAQAEIKRLEAERAGAPTQAKIEELRRQILEGAGGAGEKERKTAGEAARALVVGPTAGAPAGAPLDSATPQPAAGAPATGSPAPPPAVSASSKRGLTVQKTWD